MARVKLRHKRSGRIRLIDHRVAEALVRYGTYERIREPAAPEPTPPTPRLEDEDYNDLRRMVAEAGLEPEGRKKDDLLEALRGHYARRDMRAGG